MAQKKALIIGIHLRIATPTTTAPWHDADLIEKILISKFKFPPQNIIKLKDKDEGTSSPNHPTSVRIKSELIKLGNNCKEADNICLFFAGHSTNHFGKITFQGCDGKAVPADTVMMVANKIAQKGLLTVLLDTCKADGIFSNFFEASYNRNSPRRGVVVFSACRQDEGAGSLSQGVVMGKKKIRYGIFTSFLSTVLDKSGPSITNDELFQRLQFEVLEYIKVNKLGRQIIVQMKCTGGLNFLHFLRGLIEESSSLE